MKKRAKGFLKVLQKHGVYLDEDANPVYDQVQDDKIVKYLQRRESLVRVTLMQADLEFEYPQKLEKILVRADLLNWLDEEEEKLKNIALEEYMEKEAAENESGQAIPGDKFLLTYDDYYGNKDYSVKSAVSLKIGESGMVEKNLTYEEYAAEHISENMFDNDVSWHGCHFDSFFFV